MTNPFTKPRFISICIPLNISWREIYPTCFSRLLLLVIQIVSNCATHLLLRLTSLFSWGARADPIPTPQQLLRLRLSNPRLCSFPMSWILGRTHRPTKWYGWVYVIAYSYILVCFMENWQPKTNPVWDIIPQPMTSKLPWLAIHHIASPASLVSLDMDHWNLPEQ